MWIFAARTGDQYWRERAEHYSLLIEERQHDTSVHDLGFVFWSTWKRWFDQTGEEAIEARVIQAGRTMGLRFNEEGKFLRSFVAPDSCFIDIMMNVGIIFHAANRTSDRDLLWKAHEHCLTTRRYLVRGDGSTAHEGIFDVQTGEFLRQATHQGWRDDSSWARGQTWALYGFGTAYWLSGDERFLDTAQRCADFYIERTPSHGVPPNDWEEPSPRRPYESSAAAIAASGLLQLAALTRDAERAARYNDVRPNDPRHAPHPGVPGGRHTGLGRDPQARQLPRAQGSRRRRERDVGRVLLRRGAGQVAWRAGGVIMSRREATRREVGRRERIAQVKTLCECTKSLPWTLETEPTVQNQNLKQPTEWACG